MQRVIRYLWALPATLVGVLFGAAALAGGARARWVDGVLEIGGGRVRGAIDCLPRALRFGAITFGHVVVGIDAPTLTRCRAHERVHVRQYERFGALFFPLYVGSSLLQLARRRDPYRDNRFEREAFALAREDAAR
jgi:hypothetical protein